MISENIHESVDFIKSDFDVKRAYMSIYYDKILHTIRYYGRSSTWARRFSAFDPRDVSVSSGGGGLLSKVLYGEVPLGGSNPLPFNILIFQSSTPFKSLSKIASHSYTSRISQNNRISYNRHVFPGYSFLMIQYVVISSKMWHPLTPFSL